MCTGNGGFSIVGLSGAVRSEGREEVEKYSEPGLRAVSSRKRSLLIGTTEGAFNHPLTPRVRFCNVISAIAGRVCARFIGILLSSNSPLLFARGAVAPGNESFACDRHNGQ